MATKRLRAILEAKDAGATDTLRKFGGALSNIVQVAAGNILANFGTQMIRSLGNTAVEIVKIGTEFRKTMSGVRALTRATGADFAALTQQARDLGLTMVFTAQQVAEAEENFARAGFSTAQILKITKPALDLAAAGNLGVAEAAKIASNVLRAFNLEATEMGRVSDVLAKAANTSNTTVTGLGHAMKFAAAIGASLNFEIEEVAGAIGILANRGLDAGLAGRNLRTAFRELLTGMDETGNKTKGLGLDFSNLSDATDGVAQAIRIMNANNVDAAELYGALSSQAAFVFDLLQQAGPAAIEKMSNALKNSFGFAAETAEIRMDNLAGDTIRFKAAAANLAIELEGKLDDGLRAASQSGKNLLIALTALLSQSNFLRRVFFGLSITALQVAETLLIFALNVQIAIDSLSPLGGLLGLADKALGLVGSSVENVQKTWLLAMREMGIATEEWTSLTVEEMEEVRLTHPILLLMLETINKLKREFKDLADVAPDSLEQTRLAIEALLAILPGDDRTLVIGSRDLDAFTAFNELVREGATGLRELAKELRALSEKGKIQIESLGQTIQRNLRVVGANAATSLGDALIDAATGAEVSFKEFFKKLLIDMAKAILNALILKAILAGISGGVGAGADTSGIQSTSGFEGLGYHKGGIVRASHGFLASNRDSVPALLQPGEAVLPVALTDFLLDAASGGAGPGRAEEIEITIKSDIPAFVENVNRRVRNRSIRLEATNLVTQRGQV